MPLKTLVYIIANGVNEFQSLKTSAKYSDFKAKYEVTHSLYKAKAKCS